MAKKYNKKKIRVPFDARGNMKSWVFVEDDPLTTWKENKPFYTTLVFKKIVKGRRRVNGVFYEEGTGRDYPMFMAEFEEVIPKLVLGKITTKFTVVKRGANYGVVPHEITALEQLALQAE